MIDMPYNPLIVGSLFKDDQKIHALLSHHNDPVETMSISRARAHRPFGSRC